MSTDTRPLPAPDPREARDAEPAKRGTDLSATQVLAGALAAMTAAYLGSRLSVAGTVVGAAVASVVAAVASSVYTASLRSTHQRVRTVFQGRVAGSAVPARVETVAGRDAGAPDAASAQPGVLGAGPHRRARLSWRTVLIAAVAAFALAGIALTGLELATGSALSGGGGTTVGRVVEPGGAADVEPASSPSPSPSDASPSATPSATAEPSATASAAPSSTPEATPAPEPESSTTAPTPSAPAPSPSAGSSAPSAEPTPSASSTTDGTSGAGG